MNHQNPPPLLHLRTTTQILKRTTTVVFSTRHQFLIFLLLSLVLFSVKLETQIITHFFISNPLIKTHFAQIQFRKPKPPPNTNHGHHLTSDFNSEIKLQVIVNSPTESQINATSITLDSFNSQLGFTSKTEMSFKLTNTQKRVKDLSKIDDQRKNDPNLIATFIWIEISAFCVLTSLGFVATHSCVHGVIFVLLVNHLSKIRKPTVTILKNGVILGFRRLSGFTAAVRSVVRLTLTINLVLVGCFLGRIKDPHTIFKIFIRLTCGPFFIWFPQVEEFEQGIYGFSVLWWLLEILMSLVFTIFGCVVMVDPGKAEWAVVKEGFRLLSLNIHPVIRLKCFEDIVFGSLTRYILARIFGHSFASFIQSFVEVYFLMVWTTYYFCVKSMDANRKGEPFGKRVFKYMLRDDYIYVT